MEVSRVSFGLVAVVALVCAAILLPAAHAQVSAPAPAPAHGPASSDGTSIDQGIAYLLMAVALVLTYLIHAADFSFC